MLTKDEAMTRVANGAAHLDTVRPGWFNAIDVGTLALETCRHCIVGQLCAQEVSEQYSPALGFDLYENEMWKLPDEDRPMAFRPLQDAWIAAIADRVLAAAQAHSAPPSTNAVDPSAQPQERLVRAHE